jgi:hypothetical protein
LKLVDEIIAASTDGGHPISTLLRKCLVLAYELQNEKLKGWVEEELNGYDQKEALPEYRKIKVVSKGTFFGPFGSRIENRPIPSLILKPEHREHADIAILAQPIAAYDGEIGNAVISWPTNLVGAYQAKIIDGYALVAAWQEIPSSVFVALIDTVRNRVLKFALEIKKELGYVSDDPQAIKEETVDQIITTYIFGGTNVISGVANQVTQGGNVTVSKGDFAGLAEAIKGLGLPETAVSNLQKAIKDDSAHTPASLGGKTAKWIKDNVSKVKGPAAKAGLDMTKAILTK